MSDGASMLLQHEVSAFLYREAALLEDDLFEQWLDCLSGDVRYWMPVRESVDAAAVQSDETFLLFDDDKKSLEMRVLRIRTGQAHAEVPPSVTQRLISNVMARQEDDGRIAVRSTFQVYQERRGLHGVTFYGRRDDVLRREGGEGLRIASRQIRLAQQILPTTLSIFF